MPQTPIDPQAAEREGLIPVKCGRCKTTLAHQTKDHTTLIPNNASRVTTGRVALNCTCGGRTEWRPGKNTGKNGKA